MAVDAVSSVSGYSNISFGKRAKKHAPAPNVVTSPVKAVPLAVLLAMSPLNPVDVQASQRHEANQITTEVPQNQNKTKLIKETVYEDILPGFNDDDLVVQYLDIDNNLSTIEGVLVESEDNITISGGPYEKMGGFIDALSNYNFRVVGDDGNSAGTWTFSQIRLDNTDVVRNGSVLLNPKVITDIKKIAGSNTNNDAFYVYNVNEEIYPNRDLGLSNHTTHNSEKLIPATQKVDHSFGGVMATAEVATARGKYKLSFVTTDGNLENYEVIVAERDDGLRFKLDGVRQLNIKVKGDDATKEEITLGCIDASWPEVGKFVIYDNELFNGLVSMSKDSYINGAIKLSVENKNLAVGAGGDIYLAK